MYAELYGQYLRGEGQPVSKGQRRISEKRLLGNRRGGSLIAEHLKRELAPEGGRARAPRGGVEKTDPQSGQNPSIGHTCDLELLKGPKTTRYLRQERGDEAWRG